MKREIKTGIYKITNLINMKSYIGQAVDIYIRWQKHISGSKNPKRNSYNYPLSRAFRKYGINNFNFEILEECPIEELDKKEKYWIEIHDSFFNGYNQTMGGNQGRKILKENIIGIIKDLKETNLTIKEISIKRNVSVDTIYDINAGISWHHNIDYPIREHHRKFYYNNQNQNIYGRKNNKKKKKTRKNNKINNPLLSKKELFHLIIHYPFTQISKMYHVSDNTIRKWCKKYNLPYKYKDIKTLRNNIGNVKFYNKSPYNGITKAVYQYDMNKNLIFKYESLVSAGKYVMDEIKPKGKIDTITKCIRACCYGRQKNAYGFIWEFA